MITSMTGYGKASCELGDKIVTVEIKSLNSKQSDLYIRIPNGYRVMEPDIRNELTNSLKRGKIELSLTVEYKEGRQAAQVNAAIVKNYYHQLKSIADELGIGSNEPLLQAVLRMPETFNNEKETSDDSESHKLMQALTSAIDEVKKFRENEGNTLAVDIRSHISRIESLLGQIEPFEKERAVSFRKKLENSLHEYLPDESIDKNRFEQELIYYLEKVDITEEKTRLRHHCSYFLEVMNEDDQVGRKLGFVAQEIGREINTIGSKANHSGIQKLVVLMKDELEKVKEQIMNVL
jgi:uncharacterized protein (TIGR00255 family)